MRRHTRPRTRIAGAIAVSGLFGAAQAANTIEIDVAAYDANNNGQLDPEEETALRDAAAKAAVTKLAEPRTAAAAAAAAEPALPPESRVRVTPEITVNRLPVLGTLIAEANRFDGGGVICSSGFFSCFRENALVSLGLSHSREGEQKSRSAEVGFEVAYAVTTDLLPSPFDKSQDLVLAIAPGLSYGRDRVELSDKRQDVDRVEFEPFKLTYQWNTTQEEVPALFLGLGFSWSKTRTESLTDGTVKRESGNDFTWSPGIEFPIAGKPFKISLSHTVRFDHVFSDKQSSETELSIEIDMSKWQDGN